MRFSPNLKKILLIGTIVLVGCDFSLLFAAQNDSQPGSSTTVANDSSLQQAQAQQVQSQIRALQAQESKPGVSAGNSTLPAPPVGTVGMPGPGMIAPSAPVAPSAPNAPAVPPPIYQSDGAVTPTPERENTNNNANIPSAITDSDLNDAAYNAMVQNTFPMSSAQIQKLRSVYMASQYAATSLPITPPRPTATSVFVDLAPGSTPPVVRLAQGFVSSLVFIDSTGAPWPIEAYDIGNPSAFNIQWDKTSNTLMIQSTVLYTYGNLAVKLRGLNIPVMLTLIPGQKAVDYRVDLRVQGNGPNARSSGNSNILPPSTSTDLLNVLDGVPPNGSKVLKVEGGNCQAWLSGGRMYVRTRLSVLSPGWAATLSSADGMHAYQMQPTPMLLVSQNGQVIQLKVEGF